MIARALLLTGTAFFSLAMALPVAGATEQPMLPLKRVAISTSGLALFEHQGTVEGSADLRLPVRLESVDDVLKSLVVMDEKGSFGGVSLPGREPLSQSFRDLPFSREDLNSPVALLNALQGAEVEIAGAVPLRGRLMNVTAETETTDSGNVITRHRVSVMGEGGVKTAILERFDSLKFTEKSVQDQIDRALEAVYTNRVKDQRALTVSLKGQGARPVALTYVQEAPLWKSAYRLVMDQDGKAFLQGWAILENTTGMDWNDVNVTVLSGAPVTYRQPLYESYYVGRPVLPVKVMGLVIPRADQGTLGTVAEADGYALEEERAASPQKMKMARNMVGSSAESSNYAMADMAMAAPMSAPPMPAQMAAAPMAVAQDAATQMVFSFPAPVDLPAGNSLMVPFVSRVMPAEQVWLYQPETNAQHPLAAVKLKNEGETGLPPGILTLFEQGGAQKNILHVGDAEMPMVPKAEDRFISYALDTKTKVEQSVSEDRQLGLITISKGLLYQKVVWHSTTDYTLKAPAEEDRTIVIEHPRRHGWELVKPEGLAAEPDITPTHYRLSVKVPKGETAKLKVRLERADTESLSLVGISPEEMETRLTASGKDIKPELRRALQKIRELQSAVYSAQVQLEEIERQRQSIFADQARLRENIEKVATNNDLGKRYLKQLNEQEDTLENLNKQEQSSRAALSQAQNALAQYVSTLEL